MRYKGYTVKQAANHHVWICEEKGNPVSHVSCSKLLNEEELKELVDKILEMRTLACKHYLKDDGSDDAGK